MIGIIGATGFTGRLVAAELKKSGAPFFISGRNKRALHDLSTELGGVEERLVDVQDPATFAALNGCKVIINCAGPFTDFGEAVVAAAIERCIHYIDTTGEQNFIKLVYDKYDQPARRAGVALVPACAFEYAIADAASELYCVDMKSCSSVEIIYDMKSAYTSPGTRKSILRAISAPGYHLRHGQLERSNAAAICKSVVVNRKKISVMSFPGGESLMLPKHTRLQDVSSFMTSDLPESILPVFQFVIPLVGMMADLLIKKTIGTKAPSVAERQSTKFNIKIGSHEFPSRETLISGVDPYQLTAVIAAGSAVHFYEHGALDVGPIAPSMVNGADMIRLLVIKHGAIWKAG